VGANSNEMQAEGAREERDVDLWSDEGARVFNEIMDEGSAYISAVGYPSEDSEMYLEDEPSEYLDPEMYDPDEETLPPGEMELIFENSYVM
jgi:hypothetical protein